MTPRAIGSKAALVLVLVAVDAAWRQAKPGAIKIFAGEKYPSLCRNVLCGVAGATSDSNMLAIEVITGLRVIEAARSRGPMHHLKVGAVMVGMTLDACGAGNG